MFESRISMRPATAVALSALTLGGAAAMPATAAARTGQQATAGKAAGIARSGKRTSKKKAVKVTVKVYGKAPRYKTLLKRKVTLTGKPVARYGGSCSGRSAIGALQLATKGHWGGSWSSEYSDYEVTKIGSLNLPFRAKAKANWFWSFWVGGKEASAGVCEVMPKSGQTVMFKPACYGTACPKAKKGRKANARAKARRGR